jgi:hypothetical protein
MGLREGAAMVWGMLWILGSYAIGIILVHWFYKDSRRRDRQSAHFLLITHNSQLQVEWYIRSLIFFSKLKGRDIEVTVADEGSVDDTLAIIERISREYPLNIQSLDTPDALEAWIVEHEHKQVIVVRLGQQEELVTAYKIL